MPTARVEKPDSLWPQKVTATKRGWLDKLPSSGKSSSAWKSRWIVLEQYEDGTATLAWFSEPDSSRALKGALALSSDATVEEMAEGFVLQVPSSKSQGKLTLRHSLKEHQQSWVEAIRQAIDGKLEPSAEDQAKHAMLELSTGREKPRRSLQSMASAKVVRCKKEWGALGVDVADSTHGAGCTVRRRGRPEPRQSPCKRSHEALAPSPPWTSRTAPIALQMLTRGPRTLDRR